MVLQDGLIQVTGSEWLGDLLCIIQSLSFASRGWICIICRDMRAAIAQCSHHVREAPFPFHEILYRKLPPWGRHSSSLTISERS